MNFLSLKGIQSTFHYIPLHTSPAGQLYGEFIGNDKYTTNMSERILRLPLHNELNKKDVNLICSTIISFFSNRN